LLIENYVLDYFVIPSLRSGQRLTLSRSEGEESPQESLRLRLRVTGKKKGDRKGVILSDSEESHLFFT